MKKFFKLLFILFFITSFFIQACNKEEEKAKENISSKTTKEHKHEEGEQLYTCPMHPSVISNKPGNCPVCGMSLVKKIKVTNTSVKANIKEVSLSPSQKVMANVSIQTIKYENMTKELSAVGKVTFDEKKVYRLSSWISGRINKLYINTTGSNIAKGEKLFDIYSPDIFSAQQEFLQANESYLKLKGSKFNDIVESAKDLLDASKQKLLLMGLKESQINSLKEHNKLEPNIPIFSPESGTVIKKNIVEGQYVQAGEATFELADFSNLWVEGYINEQDLKGIKLNQEVLITFVSFHDEVIKSKISYIYPMLEADSKAVKIRLEVNNANKKLKPEMTVNLKIKFDLGKKILLPKTAVMMTGKKSIVWLEEKEGSYIPQNVTIGAMNEDSYEVIKGLKEDSKVVVSGGYLLDSESEIKNVGQQHNHGESKKVEVDSKNEKPIDMSNMKM